MIGIKYFPFARVWLALRDARNELKMANQTCTAATYKSQDVSTGLKRLGGQSIIRWRENEGTLTVCNALSSTQQHFGFSTFLRLSSSDHSLTRFWVTGLVVEVRTGRAESAERKREQTYGQKLLLRNWNVNHIRFQTRSIMVHSDEITVRVEGGRECALLSDRKVVNWIYRKVEHYSIGGIPVLNTYEELCKVRSNLEKKFPPFSRFYDVLQLARSLGLLLR